jgi:hypothetical protein
VRAVERLAQTSVSKHLWSERTPQARAVDRLNDLFAFIGAFQCVCSRRGQKTANRMRLNAIQQPVHILTRHARTRRVMYKHPIFSRRMAR